MSQRITDDPAKVARLSYPLRQGRTISPRSFGRLAKPRETSFIPEMDVLQGRYWQTHANALGADEFASPIHVCL